MEREKKTRDTKKIFVYIYMFLLTILICYVSSKIYKTDEMIWPKERFIIVVTMVIAYMMVLLKLILTPKIPLSTAVYMYHLVLIGPMLLMAVSIRAYELRPLYLIAMIVVVITADLALGIISGVAIIVSTYIMVFTNIAEFMYIALITMVLGCVSAKFIGNKKKFFAVSPFFWASSFFLCGLYRYFAPQDWYENFQMAYALVGFMVAVASSIVIFMVKYWILSIGIRMFIKEDSIPMEDMKEKSISLYYHSLEVGKLAKTAAKNIGCDISLAYAGGLLHDIGKIRGEKEMKGQLRLANEYGIPKKIKGIMVECSGKYRKPSSKEAAIVMLADSTVTSVEYIRNNNSKDIAEDKIIENVFATRVNNGSLSNSGLSLEELYKIQKTFLKIYNC